MGCCGTIKKEGAYKTSSNPKIFSLGRTQTKDKSIPETKGRSKRGSIYAINKEDISKAYIFEELLGTGYYGNVKVGVPKTDTKKKFAIKSIDTTRLSPTKISQLSREIEVLTLVDHPNIIRYFETYSEEKYFHIVMEYCTGGELLERIVDKKKDFYSEYEASEVIYKIASAIAHCHDKGIVHRDLKPENILYETKTEFSDLKIIDFGLSRRIEGPLNTVVGSPYYVAPEVLEGVSYNEKCDCWSIGVIMYVLLSGAPPFYALEKAELYEKIKYEPLKFTGSCWTKISNEAQNLVKNLLEKDPSKRLSAAGILNAPWITAFTKERYSMQDFDKEILIRMKTFHNRSQFAKSILKFVVKSMSPDKIEKLKYHFYILDKKKTGYIHMDQLKQAFSYCEIDIGNDELQALLKSKIDDKGTNQILNYTSFIAAAIDERQLLDKEILWETFKHFDVNNTGFITIDDFKVALDRSCKTRSKEFITKMFNEVGLNTDDKIDFDKFCSLLVKGEIKKDIDIKKLSNLNLQTLT